MPQQALFEDLHPYAESLQHVDGGLPDLGQDVVVAAGHPVADQGRDCRRRRRPADRRPRRCLRGLAAALQAGRQQRPRRAFAEFHSPLELGIEQPDESGPAHEVGKAGLAECPYSPDQAAHQPGAGQQEAEDPALQHPAAEALGVGMAEADHHLVGLDRREAGFSAGATEQAVGEGVRRVGADLGAVFQHVAIEGHLAPGHVGFTPGGAEDGADGLAEAALATGDDVVVQGLELLRRRFLGGAPRGPGAHRRPPTKRPGLRIPLGSNRSLIRRMMASAGPASPQAS